MRRKLLLLAALTLLVLACISKAAQGDDKDWTVGHKTDDIAIFYQIERVGSNELEVRVKVLNGRPKEVRVWLEISYEKEGYWNGAARVDDDHQATALCVVIVAAGRSNICKLEKIKTKEISKISIGRWLNEDVAKAEEKQQKEEMKRAKRIPGIRW
jgi:hypothetical protein